jgi:hypothetical protein
MRVSVVLVALAATAVFVASAGGRPTAPIAHAAAVCADYPNQAAAQAAGDTRDADGDGSYCESLPCPCSSAAGGGSTPKPKTASCTTPHAVQDITFSGRKYPNIRAHFLRAVRKGWPRILVVDRSGEGARRDRLLDGVPTRTGYDRDEYPPAVGRGRGPGLTAGINPVGWHADVAYVGTHENRSQGAVMGNELRPFCNGTRFRYVFF